MKPSLWSSFALASSVLAACGDVIVADSGDTSPHGDSTTSTTSTGTSGGAGGQGGGGADAGPPPGCPAQLAPPADCGDFADACAGAHPIAGGGDTAYARGVALDSTFVYWFAEHSLSGVCGGVIYRTPRTGGPSTRFADAPSQYAFEVDDTVLYVVEGKKEVRAFDTSTGTATDLGPIDPGSTDTDTYAVTYGLARTPGGVVAFGKGQWTPSFFHVDTAGVTPIATNVGSNGYLGSVPSFDGASLFFSWSPDPWAGMSPLFRVEAGSTATTELGAGATVRDWPSVVASDADVFFVTGDPMVKFGVVDHPMGISRVAKTGGAPTVLVPPGNVMIDQLLVDGTNIYFSVNPLLPGGPPFSIQSVPRTGGAAHTLWSSTKHPDSLRQDSGALYFALAVGKDNGEIASIGPGGLIVRVEKTGIAQ